MNGHGHGAVDLRGAGQVQVVSVRVLPVASVESIAAGVAGFQGDVTVRIVIPTTGEVLLIPGTREWLDRTIRLFADTLVQASKSSDDTGVTHD